MENFTPADTVPRGLRRWFVAHFVADILFEIPLLIAPRRFLGALGWVEIDPVSTRLVGAALFTIGVRSFLGRNDNRAAYRAILSLKVLWATCATVGLVLALFDRAPLTSAAFIPVFVGFGAAWGYYAWKLSRLP